MLHMVILAWEPDKRDEVLKRVQQLGFEHEGEKVIGTWVDIDGGRAFQLVEVPPDLDPKIDLRNSFAWNDIIKIESVHVIEAEEMVKLLSSMQ
jgi:hypothetical protein